MRVFTLKYVHAFDRKDLHDMAQWSLKEKTLKEPQEKGLAKVANSGSGIISAHILQDDT